MVKAYDRVEWHFLELVLNKMGFSSTWVSWIMQCVTSVSYGLLVNGRRVGHFTLSRGLRQGDLLSPYLFLMVADVLSIMMIRAKIDGFIDGIQIKSSNHPLTFFFFFFCK